MINAMTTTSNNNNDQLTMSSREIAEVVEKRHDSVKRTINYLESVDAIESPHRVVIPTATRPRTEYRVNQRDSYVVVAQLSPEFTARLVDRWQELEKQVAQPQVPQSFAQALRLAADTQEQLEVSNQQVKTYQKVVGIYSQAIGLVARTFPGLVIR